MSAACRFSPIGSSTLQDNVYPNADRKAKILKMHELPVMKSILDIVLQHAHKHNVRKIHAIHLDIGLLSDLEEEWMQRYFDYLSEGTPAGGSKLRIHWLPIVFKCGDCGTSFESDRRTLRDVACPSCTSHHLTLVSGREYRIKNMEVE